MTRKPTLESTGRDFAGRRWYAVVTALVGSLALGVGSANAIAGTVTSETDWTDGCQDINNCTIFYAAFTATPILAGYHVTLTEKAVAYRDNPNVSTSFVWHRYVFDGEDQPATVASGNLHQWGMTSTPTVTSNPSPGVTAYTTTATGSGDWSVVSA